MKPLIGVFVNSRFLANPKGALFASKLMQANEIAGCSVCFFSPEDIDWNRRRINATVFCFPEGRQVRRQLPFPDIIYDRGAAFPKERQREVEAIRRRFKIVEKIRFVNSSKLEKWPVIEKLRQVREVRPYLPATLLCRHVNDIRMMLQRFGFIFIKNSAGSGGTDVLSVKRQGNRYHLFFFRKGAHHRRVFSSINELLSELAGMLDLKNEKYVVQQGIRLVKYRGRPLDLRVLLNKNKYGRWVAVYNQARVAPTGAVITNLALGGEVMDYAAIVPDLKERYPRIPEDKKIREVCIVIAAAIEKMFGPFGEIGMDMAVDERGKIWLLEANSKPSKLPEDFIEDTRGVSPQFLMVLEYAAALHRQRTLAPGANKY